MFDTLMYQRFSSRRDFPPDIYMKWRCNVKCWFDVKRRRLSSDPTISIFHNRTGPNWSHNNLFVVSNVVSRNMTHVYDTDLRDFALFTMSRLLWFYTWNLKSDVRFVHCRNLLIVNRHLVYLLVGDFRMRRFVCDPFQRACDDINWIICVTSRDAPNKNVHLLDMEGWWGHCLSFDHDGGMSFSRNFILRNC